MSAVMEGIKAQKTRLAFGTSWPVHEAKGRLAKSVGQVDFGDAAFTVSGVDRRVIRRFLTRTRVLSASNSIGGDILLIKGEPGAGKTVLTQELHASLAAGVEAGRHALIPIIIFAADLTESSVAQFSGQRDGLRRFIIDYMTGQSKTWEQFARFLEANWHQYDLLIIVDGLDEIAQRTAYEAIQRGLKDMIGDELREQRRRVRRFMLSCRIDDDIGIFDEARTIVLRGLQGERERQRFCDNLVRNEALTRQQRLAIGTALREGSRSVSPVDIFRRNPYFLSLLLGFYRDQKPDDIDRTIDFEFLIESYITREIERPHAYLGKLSARQDKRGELRLALERCASLILAYLAYHMTSSTNEEALYGTFNLDEAVVDGFVHASFTQRNEDLKSPWLLIAQLLDQLTDVGPLTLEDRGRFLRTALLDQVDLTILNEVAALPRGEPPQAAIMLAFGLLAIEERVETFEWYTDFAASFAQMSIKHEGNRRQRLAALLLARGLAAAQVLRLLYIDKDPSGSHFTMRFRHRRLAEFFAATYFRDRWTGMQPISDSPWLTPVMNLVAAIEGERCLALDHFVTRLVERQPERTFTWRGTITDTAEITAFAHRGARFQTIVERFTATLLDRLHSIRVEARKSRKGHRRRDIVTELTIVTALEFLAELNLRKIGISIDNLTLFYRSGRQEPAQFILTSGRSEYAIRRLTGAVAPVRFRLTRIRQALADPMAIAGDTRKALRSGLELEWSIAAAYLATTELLMVLGSYWIIRRWWFGNTDSAMAEVLAIAFAAAFGLVRAQWWFRSPSGAAAINLIPFRVLSFWTRPEQPAEPPSKASDAEPKPQPKPEPSKVVSKGAEAGNILLGCFLIALVGGGLLFAAATLTTFLVQTFSSNTVEQQAEAPAAVGVGCKRVSLVRRELFNYAKSQTNTANIDAARAHVTDLKNKISALAEADDCQLNDRDRDYPDETIEADAIDFITLDNPSLIPLPSANGESFDNADYDNLRDFTSRTLPQPKAVDLGSLREALATYWRLSDELNNFSALVIKLRKARAAGRLSLEPENGSPSARAWPGAALLAAGALADANKQLDRAKTRQNALWSAISGQLLLLGGGLPLLGLLLLALRNFSKNRADDGRFRALKGECVETLSDELGKSSTSDRLRSRLARHILQREAVSADDVAHLDNLVQTLSTRKSTRDTKFALSLGSVVQDLAVRLGRRK